MSAARGIALRSFFLPTLETATKAAKAIPEGIAGHDFGPEKEEEREAACCGAEVLTITCADSGPLPVLCTELA